jgi:hypothetical protein
VRLHNFARFIFSTNNELSVKISDNDRRYAIISCSNEKIGDRKYFDEFSTYMSDVSNQKTIIEYLRDIDVSTVNWISDRPQSELYTLAKSACSDYLIKFLAYIYDIKRSRKEVTYAFSVFLSEFHQYLQFVEKAKSEIIQIHNTTRIGCRLKKLMTEEKFLSKVKTQSNMQYHMDIAQLRQYLEKCGMINEMNNMYYDEVESEDGE